MRKQNIAANMHKYRCLENILFDDAGFDDACELVTTATTTTQLTSTDSHCALINSTTQQQHNNAIISKHEMA